MMVWKCSCGNIYQSFEDYERHFQNFQRGKRTKKRNRGSRKKRKMAPSNLNNLNPNSDFNSSYAPNLNNSNSTDFYQSLNTSNSENDFVSPLNNSYNFFDFGNNSDSNNDFNSNLNCNSSPFDFNGNNSNSVSNFPVNNSNSNIDFDCNVNNSNFNDSDGTEEFTPEDLKKIGYTTANLKNKLNSNSNNVFETSNSNIDFDCNVNNSNSYIDFDFDCNVNNSNSNNVFETSNSNIDFDCNVNISNFNDSDGTEEFSVTDLKKIGYIPSNFSHPKVKKNTPAILSLFDIRTKPCDQKNLPLIEKAASKITGFLDSVFQHRLSFLLKSLFKLPECKNFLEKKLEKTKIELCNKYRDKFAEIYEQIEMVLYKSVKLSGQDFRLLRSEILFKKQDVEDETPFVREIFVPQKILNQNPFFQEQILNYCNSIMEKKGGGFKFKPNDLSQEILKEFGVNLSELEKEFLSNRNYYIQVSNIYVTQNGSFKWLPNFDAGNIFKNSISIFNHFDSHFLVKKAHNDFLKKKISRSVIKKKFVGVDILNPAKLDKIINEKLIETLPEDNLIIPENKIYIGEPKDIDGFCFRVLSLKVVLANLASKKKLEGEVEYSIYGDGAVIIRHSFLYIGVRINNTILEDEEFEPVVVGCLKEASSDLKVVFEFLLQDIKELSTGIQVNNSVVIFKWVLGLGDNKFQQICTCSKKGNSGMRCPRCAFNFGRNKLEEKRRETLKQILEKKKEEEKKNKKNNCCVCTSGKELEELKKCNNCKKYAHSYCLENFDTKPYICLNCEDKLTCICKRDIENLNWTACSLCSQWFHQNCLKENGKFVRKNFYCTKCCEDEYVSKRIEVSQMKLDISKNRKKILHYTPNRSKSFVQYISNKDNPEELEKLGFKTDEGAPCVFGEQNINSIEGLEEFGLQFVSFPPDNLHTLVGLIKLMVSFEKSMSKFNKKLFEQNLKKYLKKTQEGFMNGHNWRLFALQFNSILIPCIDDPERRLKVTKLFIFFVELQFLCYARETIRNEIVISRFICLIESYSFFFLQCYGDKLDNMTTGTGFLYLHNFLSHFIDFFLESNFRTSSCERGEAALTGLKDSTQNFTNKRVTDHSVVKEYFVRQHYQKPLKKVSYKYEKDSNRIFLEEFVNTETSTAIGEINFSSRHLKKRSEDVQHILELVNDEHVNLQGTGLRTFPELKKHYCNYFMQVSY